MKHQFFDTFSFVSVRSDAPDSKATFYGRFGKRCFDLIVSILLLPLALIVFAGVWVMNLGRKQSLFYVQDRVGMNGETFRCYKLQTMVDDADVVLKQLCMEDPKVKIEWDTFQKLENDPRITPAGKFLRKTSLDELPQLFNVIKGDMSLVGPRPFMLDQNDMYLAAGGRGYYTLKPGVTGEWQVRGRGKTSFASRVSFDNKYANGVSLKNDLALLVQTIGVVVRPSGS